MRLALAQIDSVVGDLEGNRDRIITRLAQARNAGADLVLFPELAVTGYPPEDLLLRPGFIQAAERTVQEIAAETEGLVALVGAPHFDGDLFNACAVCSGGSNISIMIAERTGLSASFDPSFGFSRWSRTGTSTSIFGVCSAR